MIQPARSPRVLAVLALGAQVLLSPAAFAASHTWSGTTNGNWSVGTNWSAGGPPVMNETNVVLVFPNAQLNMGSMANDVTGLAVTSITFSDTAYAVTGNAISLAGTITVDGGTLYGVASVGLDIALTGDATFVAHGATDFFLSIGGVISGGSNVVATSANGPNGFVYLPNSNTYTGTTTVHDGYLILTNALSLGAGDGTPATGTVIGPNGTLRLQGVTIANEALSAGGAGASGNGAIQSYGPTPTSWNGPVILTSPTTVVYADVTGPFTIAGNVTESAQGLSFTFRAAANVTLTGNNTYIGTDQVEYGTVIYNGMSFGNFQTNVGGTNSLPAPTLAGTGSVQAVSVGGASATNNVIDPGAPGGGTGILKVYTLTLLDANATLRLQLNGTTPGSGYDQVLAGFMATIGAGALLDVTVGFAANVGDAFTILAAGDGPVNGTFAGLPNNAFTLFSGQPFQITYTGSSVILTRAAALPVELQRFEAE